MDEGASHIFGRGLHQFLENLDGRSPVQGLAGPVVEQIGHGTKGLLIMDRQVGAFGHHLAQQARRVAQVGRATS